MRSPTARSSSSATPRSQAIATPGHAGAHHAYLVTDHARGDEPWMVLTGDALLVGDAGRPDLHAHGEQTVEEMARAPLPLADRAAAGAARPPAALPGALLRLGLRPRALGQPGLDDRLRAPPQQGAAVRRPRTRSSRRWSRDIPPAPEQQAEIVAANRSRPAARRDAREPWRRSGSACARTSRSSRCSSPINAFVGAMVGLERSTLPLIGDEEFGLGSSAAVLSFIVAFGLAKSLTNLGAGVVAERVGRRRLLILGWVVALPGAAADRARAELGLDRRRQRPARRQPGTRMVDDRRHEDRPRRARSAAGFALGLNEAAGYGGVALAAGSQRLARGRVRRARRTRRRRRRDRACRVAALGRCSSATPPPTSRSSRPRDHGSAEARAAAAGTRSPHATYRDPALRSCSQAGLVNNLNDALAWGLVPLFLAANGASGGADRSRRRDLPGRLGDRPDLAGHWSDRVGRKPLIVAGMLLQAAALGAARRLGRRVGARGRRRRRARRSAPRSSTRP